MERERSGWFGLQFGVPLCPAATKAMTLIIPPRLRPPGPFTPLRVWTRQGVLLVTDVCSRGTPRSDSLRETYVFDQIGATRASMRARSVELAARNRLVLSPFLHRSIWSMVATSRTVRRACSTRFDVSTLVITCLHRITAS